MLSVPPAASCWEHAPKAGTVWHYTSIYMLCVSVPPRREMNCAIAPAFWTALLRLKKKTHCVLYKMVLLSVSWSIKYLNIELGAKHLGCLHFKENRMHGGNEGDGARVEIQTWIFILFFFFFIGGRINLWVLVEKGQLGILYFLLVLLFW